MNQDTDVRSHHSAYSPPLSSSRVKVEVLPKAYKSLLGLPSAQLSDLTFCSPPIAHSTPAMSPPCCSSKTLSLDSSMGTAFRTSPKYHLLLGDYPDYSIKNCQHSFHHSWPLSCFISKKAQITSN